MADVRALGERIKQRRKELKLTLQDVADNVGVTKSTIQRYETGKIGTPKLPVIQAIARALNVNPAWLVGKSEKMLPAASSATSLGMEKIPLLKLSPEGVFECGEEGFPKFEEYGNENADFCMKMSGDSMIGARIYDGDIIFVKRQDDVEDGELAAVLMGDEAMLKRVFKLGDRMQLRAENPAYPPVMVSDEDSLEVKILGKAVAFQSYIK